MGATKSLIYHQTVRLSVAILMLAIMLSGCSGNPVTDQYAAGAGLRIAATAYILRADTVEQRQERALKLRGAAQTAKAVLIAASDPSLTAEQISTMMQAAFVQSGLTGNDLILATTLVEELTILVGPGALMPEQPDGDDMITAVDLAILYLGQIEIVANRFILPPAV